MIGLWFDLLGQCVGEGLLIIDRFVRRFFSACYRASFFPVKRGGTVLQRSDALLAESALFDRIGWVQSGSNLLVAVRFSFDVFYSVWFDSILLGSVCSIPFGCHSDFGGLGCYLFLALARQDGA